MPFVIVGVIVVALVIVAIVMLARKKKSSSFAGADAYRSLLGGNSGAPPKLTPAGEALRQNLRVKLLHQDEKMDAAIAFERERNPSASEEQLMKAAIERWERDNR